MKYEQTVLIYLDTNSLLKIKLWLPTAFLDYDCLKDAHSYRK